MTGRTGSLSAEGSLMSEADLARIAAEEALHLQWQRRAARVIAASARDLADCRMLLDVLGLDESILVAARAERGGVPGVATAASVAPVASANRGVAGADRVGPAERAAKPARRRRAHAA